MYCWYGDTSSHDACAAEPLAEVVDVLPEEAVLPRPATLPTDARAAKLTFLSSPPEATGSLFTAVAGGGAGHSIGGSLENNNRKKKKVEEEMR